jgi:hypothetical protein
MENEKNSQDSSIDISKINIHEDEKVPIYHGFGLFTDDLTYSRVFRAMKEFITYTEALSFANGPNFNFSAYWRGSFSLVLFFEGEDEVSKKSFEVIINSLSNLESFISKMEIISYKSGQFPENMNETKEKKFIREVFTVLALVFCKGNRIK